MKNKTLITVVAVILVTMLAAMLTGCAKKSNYGDYPAAKTQYEMKIDNNLGITGINEDLLMNADRGFRGEVYITLGQGCAYPGGTEDPYKLLEKQLNFEGANVQVIQTYVYLLEYADSDIPDAALEEMKRYFTAIRDSGAKMLLRFAYEYDENVRIGPTTGRIIKHCAQLKEWINSNMELFMDSVYAVQLGMIGLWGEGHHSVKKHNVGKVIEAVCDMVPQSLQVMVRTPNFYNSVDKELQSRLTIHDDFLVGEYHGWGIEIPHKKAELPFETEEYRKLTNMTKRTITDGEMPWGRDSTVDKIDLKLLVRQIRNYGLTTMSLTHNYMDEEEHSEFELFKARTTYITKAELEAEKFPYNPYMLDGNNQITYFDYINYHLGYQLALSNYSLTSNKVSFMITNFGMACPIGYKMEVMADSTLIKTISAVDMELYQFGQYVVNIDGNYTDKKITVRFVSEKDGNTIRLANDLINSNGIYNLN